MSDFQQNQKFFTQKELAERWRVSQSTIINLRKSGRIPFFSIPGSNKILYPIEIIFEYEQKNTAMNREEFKARNEHKESRRIKPVVSTKPNKAWRI